MVEYAIIGGTGVYGLDGDSREEVVDTRYGSVKVYVQKHGEKEIAFLPRHGAGHSTPPHMINYRANIKALESIGVKKILATAAVGSLNFSYPPGSLVVLEQFVDFTRFRPHTFYDGEEGVIHVDMADPYCRDLSRALEDTAPTAGTIISGRGTYICVEGPRFETRAEISFYRSIGGDLVGMTNVPEVVLARELGICYSAVGIVTNWCNGMVSSHISHSEIKTIMDTGREQLLKLFIKVFNNAGSDGNCGCGEGIIRI
ncbi:MAG: 5'-methylthioadenosine phosphorylase [Firmicutes bacterium]|nr:5'-methylthioadenosine phosphorylase [Bacillota bacterium]MDI6706416.1 S-methyl-5'-thioinosine phosphorylase [Bacillota bacterium]